MIMLMQFVKNRNACKFLVQVYTMRLSTTPAATTCPYINYYYLNFRKHNYSIQTFRFLVVIILIVKTLKNRYNIDYPIEYTRVVGLCFYMLLS